MSAFKFGPHNLSSINVKANGTYLYKKPLKVNYGQDIYMRVFNNLQSVCGKTFTDQGNSITPEDFKKSLCLYAFDLTPDGCHGEGTHLQRISDTIIELSFAEALERTTSVMVYCEFDEILSIDQGRNAYLASSS